MNTQSTMLVRMRWSTYQELLRLFKPAKDETTASYFERLVSSGRIATREKGREGSSPSGITQGNDSRKIESTKRKGARAKTSATPSHSDEKPVRNMLTGAHL